MIKKELLSVNIITTEEKLLVQERILDKKLLKGYYGLSDGQVEYVGELLEELFDILLPRDEMKECYEHHFTTLNMVEFNEHEEKYTDDIVRPHRNGIDQLYYCGREGR